MAFTVISKAGCWIVVSWSSFYFMLIRFVSLCSMTFITGSLWFTTIVHWPFESRTAVNEETYNFCPNLQPWSHDCDLGTWQPVCIYNGLPSAPQSCDQHLQPSLPASSESQQESQQGRSQTATTCLVSGCLLKKLLPEIQDWISAWITEWTFYSQPP